MKIKSTYVTLQQAKLLKEKGFVTPVTHYYFEDGEFKENLIKDTHGYYGDEYEVHSSEFNENWNDKWLTKKSGDRCFGCSKDKGYLETFSAPEQWQVVEWLRREYGIWITPLPIDSKMKKWYFELLYSKKKSLVCMNDSEKEFNSPQEAYSAAFDYILNELI